MDYEKKYKEEVGRATQLWECGDITRENLEYIFPELAESKDERIRKSLIEMVHDTTGDELWVDYNIHKEEAIAWLEKQGEPMEINPTEFDTRLQTLIGKFDNLPKEELIGSLSFWLNVVQNDGTYKDEEKQGEKKSQRMISAEAKEAMYDKPAWSEEDEAHIHSLLDRLNGMCKKGSTFITTRFAVNQDMDWLKSLKQRIGG